MSLFGVDDEIQQYNASFGQTWKNETLVDQVRFVVLDTETTGLNPRKDSIVSIGAVTVLKNEILLNDRYEALIRIFHNSASVVVHGVTREKAQAVGVDEATALRSLLGYLQDAVIVGHHIEFDIEILSESVQRIFGIRLQNKWVDTMELMLNLEADGLFEKGLSLSGEARNDFSLDSLCSRFHIELHDRHTAAGDAFITAQLFLKLLRLAGRAGRNTLALIGERFSE